MRTFEDVALGLRSVQRIGEDERHIAFLNPTPVRPGHVIVIPKSVSDQLFDLPTDEYGALMSFTRDTAIRMRRLLPCERVCMAVIGWQVRHVHVHLVPTNSDGEFPPLPGSVATEQELAEIARRFTRAV